MLLPANMSGAEKREKMAVMEAAISSSLSHPNIVQVCAVGCTIKPARCMVLLLPLRLTQDAGAAAAADDFCRLPPAPCPALTLCAGWLLSCACRRTPTPSGRCAKLTSSGTSS